MDPKDDFLPEPRPSTAFRRRLSAYGRREDGIASAFSLFTLLLLMMIGGLALDYANGVRLRAQLQAVADSAALAAAAKLPNPTEAHSAAAQIAELNMPLSRHGIIVAEADIVIGMWDAESQTLVTDAAEVDSVWVTARRSATNDNALATLLSWLVGLNSLDVAARSVARAGVGTMADGDETPVTGCNGGLFAMADLETGSSNEFYDGFCLHGNDGVKTGSSNNFGEGVKVTMTHLSDLNVGSSNMGIYEAASEGTHDFSLLPQIDVMIDAMRAADFSALPPFITKGPVYMDRIRNDDVLVPGTLYIVNGTVATDSGATWHDVAIVATGNVSMGSQNTYWNVVIATDGRITTGSNNTIGQFGFCDTGVFSAYLMSRQRMRFGSGNPLAGVLMLSEAEIETGSSNVGGQFVYGEAGLHVKFNSSNVFSGCAGGMLRSETAIVVPTSRPATVRRFALIK